MGVKDEKQKWFGKVLDAMGNPQMVSGVELHAAMFKALPSRYHAMMLCVWMNETMDHHGYSVLPYPYFLQPHEYKYVFPDSSVKIDSRNIYYMRDKLTKEQAMALIEEEDARIGRKREKNPAFMEAP